MATFGERMRAKRIRAGLTQAQLAEKVGVSQGTIANWENDKNEPDDDDLISIGAVIGRVNRRREETTVELDSTEEQDASSFGIWLTKERTSAGFSVPELAAKARVSPPALYGIESGRILNPRESTRAKIQTALGKAPSKEVTEEDKRENSIVGIGELTDFYPFDPEDIPTEPGVYVLYDVSQRPIYVGKSADIRSRLRDHEQKFWFKSPIVETASYVKIKDKNLRSQVESVLIKFLKSNAVINKKQVDREE